MPFCFSDVALLAVYMLASNVDQKSRHRLQDARYSFHEVHSFLLDLSMQVSIGINYRLQIVDPSCVSYQHSLLLIAFVGFGSLALLTDDRPDVVAFLVLDCLVVLGCQEQ